MFVLLIVEITCCECLKVSEGLAKVTLSLPKELASPKDQGLFPKGKTEVSIRHSNITLLGCRSPRLPRLPLPSSASLGPQEMLYSGVPCPWATCGLGDLRCAFLAEIILLRLSFLTCTRAGPVGS